MNLLPFWKEGGYITNRYRDASQPVLKKKRRSNDESTEPTSSTGDIYWPKLSSSSRLPSMRSSRLPSTRSSPFCTVWICFSSARTFLGPRYLRSARDEPGEHGSI